MRKRAVVAEFRFDAAVKSSTLNDLIRRTMHS
jgi:hypothetical protein